MPVVAWWAVMPFALFAAAFLAHGLSSMILAPYHLPTVRDGDGFPAPAPEHAYLASFIGPFLLGLLWTWFAPYTRCVAALLVGLFNVMPCSFCVRFDFESPMAYDSGVQIICMIAGAVVPIGFYLFLDRKEIKLL